MRVRITFMSIQSNFFYIWCRQLNNMAEEGLTDRDVKAVSFMLQACNILELGSTHLGLTYTELKGILRDVCSSKDAAYETLKLWTRKLPEPATVEILKKHWLCMKARTN